MRFLILLTLAAIAAAQSPTANPSGLTGLRGCTIPFRANVAPVAGQSGQFTVVFTPQVQMPDVDVNLLYSINKTPTAPGKIEFDFNVKMTKMDGSMSYTIPSLNEGDKLLFAFAYQLPNANNACTTGAVIKTVSTTGATGESEVESAPSASTSTSTSEAEKENVKAFAPEQQFSPQQLQQMEQLSNEAIANEIERLKFEQNLLSRQRMQQGQGGYGRSAISRGWRGGHGGGGFGLGGGRRWGRDRGLGLGLGLGLGYPYGYGYPPTPGYGYGAGAYGYPYGYGGYGGYGYPGFGYPGYENPETGLGTEGPVVCPQGYGFDMRAQLCVPVPTGVPLPPE